MIRLPIQFFMRVLAVSAGLAMLLSAPVRADERAEADKGTAPDRYQRIEKLLKDVRAELDSLKRESAQIPEQAGGSREKPILGELLSDRQRALAKATRTDMRDQAAGYTFNTDLPIGLHALYWWDPWGVKLEGGAIITDLTRIAGLNVAGLYSIHRFDALDLLETHLYAFAGAGYYWERVLWSSNIAEPFYETPDRWVRAQLGVGTEFSFFELGGVRFAPETGLQADHFFSRYQESTSYTYGNAPASDNSLSPFVAFHLSFYFR